MIEDVITLALSRMQPSSHDDLVGFTIDAEWALEEQGIFDSIKISIGDDPRSLVNALLVVKPSIEQIQTVVQGLAGAWPSIAYNDFQALEIKKFIEGTVLRFVTCIPGGSLCATGTFIARSSKYLTLVDRFNAEYASLVGPISSMPGGLPKWAT